MAGLSTIRRGFSLSTDPAVAVRELHEAVAQPDTALVVFFCSSAYDLDALAGELHRRFAGVTLIGCTTAGEITPVGYQEGSITGFSIGGTRQPRGDHAHRLPGRLRHQRRLPRR